MRISKYIRVNLFVCAVLMTLAPLTVYAGKKQETITCSFDTQIKPYDSGDQFMLCINYIPLMIKENTYLAVGKTTIIHQKFMWRIFEKIETDVVFQIANSKAYSRALPFNRPQSSMSFPFIPLVITLDYGKVIDISIQAINDICINETVKPSIIGKFYKTSRCSNT